MKTSKFSQIERFIMFFFAYTLLNKTVHKDKDKLIL
jgi:hypothetical protein